MHVVYVPDEPPETYSKSLFLAGPSPRSPSHPNWRPDALKLLEAAGYDGVVFVPLPEDGKWPKDFDLQVDWEIKNLDRADQLVFWIPRDMRPGIPELPYNARDVYGQWRFAGHDDFADSQLSSKIADHTRLAMTSLAPIAPALTTNVEWGRYYDSGRAVLGYPPGTPNMRYLETIGQDEAVPSFGTLDATLAEAVRRIGKGARRTGGERDIPLHIWNLPHFQDWYKAQTAAGNRLDGVKVLWTFRIGAEKEFTFGLALHVDVHITAKGRNKAREFIICRPDIATVVAYQRPGGDDVFHSEESYLMGTEVAIIKEFRSPALGGYVYEVPGGSSWEPGTDPEETAVQELEDETGLCVDPARLREVGSRQLCGTLSVHQAHTFALELTQSEMAYLKQQAAGRAVHGVEEDTERTYTQVHTVRDLLEGRPGLLDWSMLGQILAALVQ